MDNKVVDSIMKEFDNLSHGEQVDLFLEIRNRLLINRDVRIANFKENAEVAAKNLQSLDDGNKIIINPESVSVK